MPNEISLEEVVYLVKTARDPLELDLSQNDLGNVGAGLIAEAIKVAQAPLNLNLSENFIGNVGAGPIAEAIKVAQAPLNLNLRGNVIGDVGAGLIAEAIKVAQIPLNLNLSENSIGGLGIGLLAEAIKVAQVTLNLDLSRNGSAIRLLVEAIKVAKVPLTLDLSYIGMRAARAKLLAEAIRCAQAPLTLDLSQNLIGKDSVGLLAQSLMVAKVPLNVSLSPKATAEKTNWSKHWYKYESLLAVAKKDNFVVDARSEPSKFLSRIGFSLSRKILEQTLNCPSVIALMVQGYIEDDLAWAEVAAIRAVDGASQDNKYDSINYELLSAAYSIPLGVAAASGLDVDQMEDDEQEERRVVHKTTAVVSSSRPRKRKRNSDNKPATEPLGEEHYYNASSIEDSASSSSSSTSSSSSYDSFTPGGGVSDSVEFPNQMAALSSSAQPIWQDRKQSSQVDNTPVAETLLKTLFAWIKDLADEQQQQLLSSFSKQQLLELLDSTINPHKFIADQLGNKSIDEMFTLEYQQHYGDAIESNTTEYYAKASQQDSASIQDSPDAVLPIGLWMPAFSY